MDIFTFVFKDMLLDWPLGTLAAVTLIIAAVIILCLVAWGIYGVVDSWGLSKRQATGKVIGKVYTPSRISVMYVYNDALKTSLPHPIPIPEDWSISVRIIDQSASMSVTNDFYDLLNVDQPVLAEYVSGRISGGIYLKKLTRM